MTTTDYCCAGMLKGRMSGIISLHDTGTMLTVRLALDERAPGIQPFLILRYCPSCGARLPDIATDGSETALPSTPSGQLVHFPNMRLLN